jgi:hypothetical protein
MLSGVVLNFKKPNLQSRNNRKHEVHALPDFEQSPCQGNDQSGKADPL